MNKVYQIRLKRIYVCIITILYLFTCFNFSSYGYGDNYTEITEGNFKYRIRNSTASLVQYFGTASSVTIPAKTNGGYPVTSIGDGYTDQSGSKTGYSTGMNYTGQANTTLTSVIIPEGVITIDDGAFYNCHTLANVSLPSTLTKIEFGAFVDCWELQTLSLPSSITYLGSNFIRGAPVNTLVIPHGVADIGTALRYSTVRTVTFLSGTTIIPDDYRTIYSGNSSGGSSDEFKTLIKGYAGSTAKAYAEKYPTLFKFQEIQKTLLSISLDSTNVKLNYKIGETLDITGLVVNGAYSDGSTQEVNITSANVSGFNSTQAATDKVLTVSVSGKSSTYKINVLTPNSLEITSPATKLDYNLGDTLDISGLEVVGKYSDDTTIPVNIAANNITGFNSSVAAESQTLTITAFGRTTTYNVKISGPQSIEVNTPATKSTYKLGESLDITGLTVRGIFSGDVEKDLSISQSDISGFDSSMPVNGQVITITIGDKTTTFTVDIIGPESISISVPAQRLIFPVGSTLDITGIEITANYSGDETKTINITKDNVTGFDSSTEVDGQILTITVAEKITSYTVDIKNPTSISVTGAASKLVYKIGESLDLSGLEVTGTYPGDITYVEPISPSHITGFDSSKITETQELTITYFGQTLNYTISVIGPDSISIKTLAAKLSYKTGESLDIAELAVEGTYSDFSKRIENITAENITGFDSSNLADTQTLTITFAEKTTTYDIQIIAPDSISITKPASKLSYTVGDKLDITGLEVTGTYPDSSTRVETISKNDITGFNSASAVKSQTLTITILGKIVTYTVSIVASPSNSSINNSVPTSIPTSTSTPTEAKATPNVKDEDKKKNLDDSSLIVIATTDTKGNASAKITQSEANTAINKALAKAVKDGKEASAKILFEVETPATANAVEVNIDKDSIKLIHEGKADSFTISSQVASISFDKKTFSTISNANLGDIKITASKVEASTLSPDTRQIVGDRPVYDFNVTSEEKTISQFGGNVAVSVPYSPKPEEDINAIVVYYINDKGVAEIVKNCKYEATTGKITFKTTHFSKYAIGYNKLSFSDVTSNAWYSDAVSFASSRGITVGNGNGKFEPESKLTRGQFIVMVMRAYNLKPDENWTENFKDAGNTYYSGYLSSAKRLGITNGIGNDLYAPNKEITRQEMFSMLYNILKKIEQLPAISDGENIERFGDSGNIATWAKEAMTLFVNNGIINSSNVKLNPQDLTNRAQMAQVIYNLSNMTL
ncbi:MAG TPA: bacterial Ig-like domain-containing protein [Pseudobacteroides sp.]|uniref:bacterial Ig-like domain-containing protein n=1 Tax=Pseudobacteroides sp. TaxID=1968840 RepID=UPI002F938931